MGDFERDTEVRGADGRYEATLSEDWAIWGPNGGYVAAIALRAAGAESAQPRPASFSCQFLGVARFAPIEIRVQRLRSTRVAEALRVSLAQENRPVLEALVWTAAEIEGLGHDTLTAPEVPEPETLTSSAELSERHGLDRAPHPFWGNFDSHPTNWRPHDSLEPAPPEHRSWYRFRPRSRFEDPFVDAGRSLLLVDTMCWPAAREHHRGDIEFIAPSIDATVHFHRDARDSDWLLCDTAAPIGETGLIAGRSTIFDESRRAVASGVVHMICRPVPAVAIPRR